MPRGASPSRSARLSRLVPNFKLGASISDAWTELLDYVDTQLTEAFRPRRPSSEHTTSTSRAEPAFVDKVFRRVVDKYLDRKTYEMFENTRAHRHDDDARISSSLIDDLPGGPLEA